MKEVYEKLHETNEDWVDEKRRARDYQAAIYEKDKALQKVLESLEGGILEDDVYGKNVSEIEKIVKKALKA